MYNKVSSSEELRVLLRVRFKDLLKIQRKETVDYFAAINRYVFTHRLISP